MATKNLLDTIRKNTTQAVSAAKPKAEEDRKAHAAPSPAPAPVAPVNDAAQAAFRAQATANLTKTPAKGLLDTIEPVDPSRMRIQATTRMSGASHKAVTVKMPKLLIRAIEKHTRKQNIAAYIVHSLAKDLAATLEKMAEEGATASHEAYDEDDRNAFCGVTSSLLLAEIAWLEQNPEEE